MSENIYTEANVNVNELTDNDLMIIFDIDEEVISDMRVKYDRHKIPCLPTHPNRKLDANKDPVEFLMTFMEWAYIWQESGHWHERGVEKGQYCMMRNNDIGHYEVGNVTIGLHSQNASDKKHTDETKAKIGAASKGRKHTDETKAKIGAAKKGNQHGLGSKHTDEWKEAQSKRNKGAKHPYADHMIRHWINKDGRTFTGTRIQLREAFPDDKLTSSGLSSMINPNHKLKSHCGWSVVV